MISKILPVRKKGAKNDIINSGKQVDNFNNVIPLDWINLSLTSFKIKCKYLLLTGGTKTK